MKAHVSFSTEIIVLWAKIVLFRRGELLIVAKGSDELSGKLRV
jgi:hypothetical protein